MGVQRHVLVLSNILALGTVLLLAASIVTPLGLRDVYRLKHIPSARFEYSIDRSAFGDLATVAMESRGQYIASRECSNPSMECPGRNSSNRGIPGNLTEIFTSAHGLYGSGVANIFDIQPRSFHLQRIDNQPTVLGDFRFLETLIQDGRIKLIEGLIVDTEMGGIGFRNHSMPGDIPLGAEWEETLLWMEPSTACVNNNLTILFEADGTSVNGSPLLSDKGGFMDVLGTPLPPPPTLNTSRTDPSLHQRAYTGAYYLNIAIADLMNMSSETVSHGYGTTYNIRNDVLWDLILQSIKPYQVSRIIVGATESDPGTAGRIPKILSSVDVY